MGNCVPVLRIPDSSTSKPRCVSHVNTPRGKIENSIQENSVSSQHQKPELCVKPQIASSREPSIILTFWRLCVFVKSSLQSIFTFSFLFLGWSWCMYMSFFFFKGVWILGFLFLYFWLFQLKTCFFLTSYVTCIATSSKGFMILFIWCWVLFVSGDWITISLNFLESIPWSGEISVPSP